MNIKTRTTIVGWNSRYTFYEIHIIIIHLIENSIKFFFPNSFYQRFFEQMNEDNTLSFYIKHSLDIFRNLIEFHPQIYFET